MSWLQFINKQKSNNDDYVIITVAETKGSTPCNIGQKIIYSGDDNFYGSIGGGNFEFKALMNAKKMLNLASNHIEIVRYPLGASLGQCCGGYVKVMFESFLCRGKSNEEESWINYVNEMAEKSADFVVVTVIDKSLARKINSSKFVYVQSDKDGINLKGINKVDAKELSMKLNLTEINDNLTEPVQLKEKDSVCYESFAYSQQQAVAVFGAGHVSRALMPILTQLPITIHWIDDRKSQFELYDGDKSKINIVCEEMSESVLDLPKNIYCMIITYSHQLDFEICEQIMSRDSFCYLGVIGSKIKGDKFRERLKNKGISDKLVEKLMCPMGVKHKVIKSPVSIAISIATDLINFLENNKQINLI